jgi:2,4-dienoyl-CoA reductase-like NADH-dependent reductase (Old Yellow Enzyme family)
MTRLFDPLRLGGLELANRIVKSATVEGLADDRGCATAELAELYAQWARGGTGLIITGMVTILAGFSLTPHEVGLWDDMQIRPLRRALDAAHRHGARIFVQLSHAAPQLSRAAARRLGNFAPSPGLNRTNLLRNRALSQEQIAQIIQAFGSAARRAREAGADGVQLHAAHGYLLSRFLSPLHNRRRDSWGGDLKRRAALLREVAASIRRQAGSDFPIAVKLNAHDAARGGLTPEESVRVARWLEEWGVAAIEVSAGTGDVGLGFYPNRGQIPLDLGFRFLQQEFGVPPRLLPWLTPVIRRAQRQVAFGKEAYFLPEAQRIAEAVRVPVLAVGGIRSRSTAARIVDETPVAMISMARPLVRQPDLVQRWQAGSGVAACTSCNRCFVALALGESLRCREPA